MKTQYWWLSWYQLTEDCRPLTFPPGEAILGWWNRGERCSDGATTIVAHVCANSEEEAKGIIREDWPEAAEWRFCTPCDMQKSTDRFPLADWMESRYRKVSEVMK